MRTPWLCAYWPVRNVARDGQHCESETNELLKLTPWSPISRCVSGIDGQVGGGLVVGLDDHDVRARRGAGGAGRQHEQEREQQSGTPSP